MFFIKNTIDGYKKAFCYKGVADRKTWLSFTLFLLLTSLLFDLILLFLGISPDGDGVPQVGVAVLILILSVGLLYLLPLSGHFSLS